MKWTDEKIVEWHKQAFPNATLETQLKKVEEQQEATEKDIGKLCWFWDDNVNKFIEVLDVCDKDYKIPYECGLGWYNHCRPLTKAEIQEFMEKAE